MVDTIMVETMIETTVETMMEGVGQVDERERADVRY